MGNGEFKLKWYTYKEDYTQISQNAKYSNALENSSSDFHVSNCAQVYFVFNTADYLHLSCNLESEYSFAYVPW